MSGADPDPIERVEADVANSHPGRPVGSMHELVDRYLDDTSSSKVPDRTPELHAARLSQETQQSKTLFKWALWAVSAQLIAADVVFLIYVIVTWSRGDDVPAPVISAWLAATVVEVVGIVAIIARSLFPPDPKR